MPPGTLVPKALCFTRDVFFLFFYSPGYLRAPSADRHETLARDRNMGVLYNASPKIRGGGLPRRNSARFQTTSDFDREYLRNGRRYPKSESNMMISDSSRVLPKKSGELWSTNYRERYVSLDPPKVHLSRDYISALRGCWPTNFNTH